MTLFDESSTEERALLQARYGRTPPHIPAPLSNAIAGQLAHRSVRRFQDRPIASGMLQAIIAAAQSASTSSNLQQWSVVAVQEKARKAELAALCGNQQAILEAPLFLAWLADLSRLEAHADGAPVDVLHHFESLIEGVIDVSLAAQNAVVALEALGLGAVFIGSLRNRPEDVAATLTLPPRVAPLFGLCVGYPSEHVNTAIKPRLPQAAVLHQEQYDAAASAAFAAVFDDVTRDHQIAEGRPGAGWLKPSLSRLGDVARMGGRERLRDALAALGFGLR